MILIFNQNLKYYSNQIKEINFFRVPVILINNDLKQSILECDYKVFGNFNFFEKMPVNNLLLGILKSVMERACVRKTFVPIRLKEKRRYKKRKNK